MRDWNPHIEHDVPALDERTEALIGRIRERARNLYESRQMLCTEAVLSALNHGLDGGLTDAQATAMAAPFCAALGESGCMCGALTGAVMSSGLLLGRDHPHRHRHAMRDHARRLHDRFKAVHGATCCRALSGKVKHDKNAHFQFCADLTAHAAEMAARLILRERPELAEQADQEFLDHRQSVIGGAYRRVMRLLFG